MKRHPFDAISFAAGAVLLLIAGTAAFGSNTDLDLDGWLIPVSVLVLGIGILAASLRGIRDGEAAGNGAEPVGSVRLDEKEG